MHWYQLIVFILLWKLILQSLITEHCRPADFVLDKILESAITTASAAPWPKFWANSWCYHGIICYVFYDVFDICNVVFSFCYYVSILRGGMWCMWWYICSYKLDISWDHPGLLIWNILLQNHSLVVIESDPSVGKVDQHKSGQGGSYWTIRRDAMWNIWTPHGHLSSDIDHKIWQQLIRI